jgi:hypothetical protein
MEMTAMRAFANPIGIFIKHYINPMEGISDELVDSCCQTTTASVNIIVLFYIHHIKKQHPVIRTADFFFSKLTLLPLSALITTKETAKSGFRHHPPAVSTAAYIATTTKKLKVGEKKTFNKHFVHKG